MATGRRGEPVTNVSSAKGSQAGLSRPRAPQPQIWQLTALAAAALAGFALNGTARAAALAYANPGQPYTENFNSLATSGSSNAWTNGAAASGAGGIAGFYVFNSGATNAGTGRSPGAVDNVAPASWVATGTYTVSVANSRLSSFGTDGDRALGSQAGSSTSAGTSPGDFFYALVLQNTTGQTLTSFNLSYVGEQWGEAAATSGVPAPAQSLRFSYRVADAFSPADIPTQQGLGDYTPVGGLDFTMPTTGTTGAAVTLDGNDPANRTAVSATVSTTWAPSAYLVLRFWDDDDNGVDHTMGIDDLSFSATAAAPVPEPLGPGAVAVVTGLGLTARRKRRAGA
jgi:hypothetical protein